ncbi:hypothetical protein K1719_012115 [Acacia pycnantha]|nr:hypothetical protein K1719_012115 [Acacia pycnantha]
MEYCDHCEIFCVLRCESGPNETRSCSICGKVLSDKLTRRSRRNKRQRKVDCYTNKEKDIIIQQKMKRKKMN